MKIFLISQIENNDYDTYDSAVVCAVDEEAARKITPDGHPFVTDRYRNWCSSADKVKVMYIGEAAEEIPSGAVCASFNAR